MLNLDRLGKGGEGGEGGNSNRSLLNCRNCKHRFSDGFDNKSYCHIFRETVMIGYHVVKIDMTRCPHYVYKIR